jgi:4'-phosphopantetheinyl transferase EntD
VPHPSQFPAPLTANVAQQAISSSLIEALFPAGVAAAEFRLPGDASLLDPAEAVLVARAMPKRIGEFAAGRLCARSALARFGIERFALRAGVDRQPIWPEGIVGSITHTAGFCAAVVGPGARFAALGLDTESADSVRPELWRSICGATEIDWIESLPSPTRASAATLVFSAKEAFYKCQYPCTGERLSFHDVEVRPTDWGAERGHFTILARNPRARFAAFAGALRAAYRFHDPFVSTGVALCATERSA